RWVEEFVLDLGLCPFAARPWQEGRVRVVASRADTLAEVLAELLDECTSLDEADPGLDEGEQDPSTSLLVLPGHLEEFDEFLDFVLAAEALMEREGQGLRYQLVSFHPRYRFEGVPEDDPANATNRAPWPTLQLLRRSDVRRAVREHPDITGIPLRNMALLRAMASDAGDTGANGGP
ncbi:MAG: DUF1415 domain-containing protein, partial [Myxococcota bacterium]|nr:DUF1415 domain-containing protein [Myxococcota bacterium]